MTPSEAAMTVQLPWPSADLSPNGRLNERITLMHGTMPNKDLALSLGITLGSIRARITRLGLSKKVLWTDEEENDLRIIYQNAGGQGFLDLKPFCDRIGRDVSNVSRKARELGLATSPHRSRVSVKKPRNKHLTLEAARSAVSAAMKTRLAENGHPRGMQGKQHTPETKSYISETSRQRWLDMTNDERDAQILKGLKTKTERYGTIAPKNGGRGSWKAGWREIGGKRNYYRSRWEANYARYLQWLKENGAIKEWQHEPETFWFEKILRGVRSYLPDFRVWENNGDTCLHEVKGWFDARSKTTLKRMAKYHPQHKLLVIDGKQYRSIRGKVMALIPDWEDAKRDTHA